jgi:hypothetical protein
MSRPPRPADANLWRWNNPWLLLGGALASAALTCLAVPWSPAPLTLLNLALALGGLTVAGGAVWLRCRQADGSFEARTETAGLIALAAVVPLLVHVGLPREFDSGRLFLGVLLAVALASALLLLLPRGLRRLAVSLLIVFHFGGILTAVFSPPPPTGTPPWVVRQLWLHVYRPYLLFMYMNNAYHFYSPEPAPSVQLWFHVRYDDGGGRWVKVPEKGKYPTLQQFQRRIALTDSANTVETRPSKDFEWLVHLRKEAGQRYDIPMHPTAPLNLQRMAPTGYSRYMVGAYARHVARNYPSENNPGAKVTGVKVYKAVHMIIDPVHLAEGNHPLDPTLYLPYYQGEFDAEGRLKFPNDPFLYWVIPILHGKGKGAAFTPFTPDAKTTKPDPDEYAIVDFVEEHVNLP